MARRDSLSATPLLYKIFLPFASTMDVILLLFYYYYLCQCSSLLLLLFQSEDQRTNNRTVLLLKQIIWKAGRLCEREFAIISDTKRLKGIKRSPQRVINPEWKKKKWKKRKRNRSKLKRITRQVESQKGSSVWSMLNDNLLLFWM